MKNKEIKIVMTTNDQSAISPANTILFIDNEPVGCIQDIKLNINAMSNSPTLDITFKELGTDGSVMTVNNLGDKIWTDKDGKYHREDGPAVEYPDGSKFWYQHGKYHREDGPAIESSNGNKYWWRHDEPHREDGPAFEYANGNKSWFLNGKYVSEAEVKALEKMK